MIQVVEPRLAGRITGMLLEMDDEELLKVLVDQRALMEKINEALAVLKNQQEQMLKENKECDEQKENMENEAVLENEEKHVQMAPNRAMTTDEICTFVDNVIKHNYNKRVFISYNGEPCPFQPRPITLLCWDQVNVSFLAECHINHKPRHQRFCVRNILEVRGKAWNLSKKEVMRLRAKYNENQDAGVDDIKKEKDLDPDVKKEDDQFPTFCYSVQNLWEQRRSIMDRYTHFEDLIVEDENFEEIERIKINTKSPRRQRTNAILNELCSDHHSPPKRKTIVRAAIREINELL